jgi:hypothetical protein
MTDKVLVFNQSSLAADTIEEFYISPAARQGTIIKAFTTTNDTGSSKSYKAYIYNESGAMVSSIIPFTVVVRDRVDYGASAANQVIPAGGSLRIESSSADGLNFYVTGLEQSV